MKKSDNKSDSSQLRRKAEELLVKKKSVSDTQLSEIEILKLNHELEVHQIELELQNDELSRAREQAEAVSEKFIELYDFAPSGYFTLSSEGRIIELNLAGSQMLGKERSRIKNDLFVLSVSEETRPVFNQFIKKIFKNKARESCDVILSIKNSMPEYVHLNGIISEKGGQCLVSAVDITDLRKAEDEKLEMQKQVSHLQNLERIGLLAGGFAHNFNNFLSVVLANLEYLDFFEIKNPEISRHVENAKDYINKAAALIKQLRAFAGTASYAMKELDINSLINSSLEFFKTVTGAQNRLETDLDSNLPLITGDKDEILRVLINLLYNASEAIGENSGVIRISTGVQYFDEKIPVKHQLSQKKLPGDFVFVKVYDNGRGMDKDTVNNIFEPFFTDKNTGRGLSMPAARGVLNAHDGAIIVDSIFNQGSTITLLFPVPEPRKIPGKYSLKNEKVKRIDVRFKGTLLVADDEIVLLEILASMLEFVGFTVLKAINGIEAVELFKSNSADIDGLLFDLTMPGLGGVAAVKAIQDLDRNIRVVFLSGYDISYRISDMDSVNYNAFIQKPFDINKLFDTLATVFKDLVI